MKAFDPKWRTSTVIELCQSMREAQEFSALPILADALQDADCDDEELLGNLRAGTLPYVESATTLALILRADARESVKRIEEIADALGGPGEYDSDGEINRQEGMSYHALIEAARAYVESKKREEWGEYFHMGTNESYKDDAVFPAREFWRHFQVITGVTVEDDEASFFSCGC